MTDKDGRHRLWLDLARVCPEELAPIRQYIIANEGWHQTAYCDSRGIPTIGVGFNLHRDDAAAKIGALGPNYAKVLNRDQALSDGQIETPLAQDLDVAATGAMRRPSATARPSAEASRQPLRLL